MRLFKHLYPSYPIVVVGAGPAGLVAAITLARQGVKTLLLEKRSRPPSQPRATVLSLRTMELLRSWGLEDQILAASDDVDMAMLETPTLARARQGTRIDVGYPNAAQSRVLSPTAAACVAQDELESVLLAHLVTLPAAEVALGIEVDGVTAGTSETALHVLDRATSERRTLSVQYVIAADGARSRLRSALGIAMVGPDAIFGGMMAEFRAPLWDILGRERFLLYSTTAPGAVGTVLPAGQSDRWLFGLPEQFEPDRQPGIEAVARQIRQAAGAGDLPVSVDRIGSFSSGAQLAETFRVGNVFLAGDAAHRITPRGGTGLNTAIADGRDLGWKLLWVLQGWAPAALLASYESERRPAVQHNVERSADPAGSRRGVDTEVPVDLGGRLAHLWIDQPLASSAARRSTLDLLGPGLTLLTAGDSSWRRATAAAADEPGSPSVELAPLDLVSARALGVGSSGALLVRPDGLPVASWWMAGEPGRDLRQAISGLLHGPRPAMDEPLRTQPGRAA